MKIFIALLKKRYEIYKIYRDGIHKPYYLLRWTLPLITIVFFSTLLNCLNLSASDIKDLLKQVNSLSGIILGFSIASLAIFISLNNDKLEKASIKAKQYTNRQIGSALFFYNVERSLFISIFGILLSYTNIPSISLDGFVPFILSILFNFEIVWTVLYFLVFFQLLFNLFYSSIFLNSSIE
jgi:hypothetical protein